MVLQNQISFVPWAKEQYCDMQKYNLIKNKQFDDLALHTIHVLFVQATRKEHLGL